MAADILAQRLSENADIAELVTGIRPVNASGKDRRPFLVYETTTWSAMLALNCETGVFMGTVRFYVASDSHAQCSQVAELVKTDLNGARGDENSDYRITYCRLNEEEDIAQEIDEREKPYYVKALDFEVRARRI